MRYFSCTLLCVCFASTGFAQSGTLDPTFGVGGIAQFQTSNHTEEAHDLLPMADGRILVCGVTRPVLTDVAFIVRLLPDGSLDAAYDTVYLSSGANGAAYAMAFAADSSVYLCGYADTLNSEKFTLWHVLIDGTPDPAFGINGRVSILDTGLSPDLRAHDLVVQPDGKIVLAGSYDVGNRMGMMARVNTDGTLDTTFSGDGLLPIDLNPATDDELLCAALFDDGSIAAGGYVTTAGNRHPTLVKVTTAGTMDISFDFDGNLQPPVVLITSQVNDLVISGSTVVAVGSSPITSTSAADYFLLRSSATGVLDPIFGAGGIQYVNVGYSDWIGGTCALPDGRIIVTGYSGNMSTNGPIDVLIACHNTDGTFVPSFGTTGHTVTDVSAGYDIGFAVKAQTDGKLLVCGRSASTGDTAIVVLRYDYDFGTLLPQPFTVLHTMVSPNPASDVILLDLPSRSRAHLQLLDPSGRILWEEWVKDEHPLVSVRDLRQGCYVIRCDQDGAIRSALVQVMR